MTIPLPISPLVDGLLAMVRATVPATLKVYEGRAAQNAVPPYVVFYFDTSRKGAFDRNLLNDGPRELRYQTTSVGATTDQTRWVVDKVLAALYGGVPTVPGRRVHPVIEEGGQPIQPDDTSTGLFYATTQWLTRSDPT